VPFLDGREFAIFSIQIKALLNLKAFSCGFQVYRVDDNAAATAAPVMAALR
jgi:hypothetical protein